MPPEHPLTRIVEKFAEDHNKFLGNHFQRGYSHLFLGESHHVGKFHSSLADQLPLLKQAYGLNYLCLEMDHISQDSVNSFLATGHERFLNEVLNNEAKKSRNAHKDRVGSGYYHILESARQIGLQVITIDAHQARDRDKFMAGKLPVEGPALVYVGELHLFNTPGLDGCLPFQFKQRIDRNAVRILQSLPDMRDIRIKILLQSIASRSSRLKDSHGFGINLKDNNLFRYFDAFLGLEEGQSVEEWGDSIWIHHP